MKIPKQNPFCRAGRSLVALCLGGLSAAMPGLAAQAAPPVPWMKMPLRSPDAQARGVSPGGEGGQWPRGAVAVGPADPNFLLLPIDVGGLYRSLDGGAHWNVAMVGWNARGANGFALDPKNAAHVLGIAGNSLTWNPDWGPSPHGLYLSTNKAASWTQVLVRNGGFNGAAAFDPSSFDTGKGLCTRAYYLADGDGVFRTDDGGRTWAAVHGPIAAAPGRPWDQGGGFGSHLTIAKNGTVYVAGVDGLSRSTDRGKTFVLLRPGEVDGLALLPNGTLYLSDTAGVSVSRDGGKTFTRLPGKGMDREEGSVVAGLTLSPADPQRMLCWATGKNFQWPRFVSLDGGATWRKITLAKGIAPLPMNGRQGYMAWSPVNPRIAWGLGGDWVTQSTDGGQTFHWANNGNNGIMVGGMFGFSPHAPNMVYLSFQDYNGAVTTDGGKTWAYRDVSGKGWGGSEYGGLAVDATLLVSGDAESWGGTRRLRVSRDGGRTWQFENGPDSKPLEFHGPDVSFADPADPKVCFASDLRSANHGDTWARMPGCDGVFTAVPGTNVLYGKKGDTVVLSRDHGVSWETVAAVDGGFNDLAVDGKTGRVYVASQDRLKVFENGQWTMLNTPQDQYGNVRVWTVAVDPQMPSVMYVGGPRNTYASMATVCRSVDGGKTWRNLTVTTPIAPTGDSGPHEVACIRVHPVTRQVWLNGQCYGMWTLPPPR